MNRKIRGSVEHQNRIIRSHSKFIRLTSLVLILTLALPLVSGCISAGADQPLNFADLIAQADKHNGKTVTVEAFYFSGFEISAIAGSLEPHHSGMWGLIPTGPLVWVKGGITQELLDKMYTQTVTPSGYTEHFGKLKVTGKFETGKFGHLDAYDYRIDITAAELLDWTPIPLSTASPTDQTDPRTKSIITDMKETRSI
jgi:hypothetical protein